MDFDKSNTFYIVPCEVIDDLIKAVKDIRSLQEKLSSSDNKEILGDFISEEEAMLLLNRGKTWFWQKRNSGELPGKKAAGRWYYSKRAINQFISHGRPF